MYKILFVISCFFLLSAALARLLDIWLSESTKEKFKDKIDDILSNMDYVDSNMIAKAPLKLLELFHNTIFGSKVFSKKAYFRASVISIIVLISLLSISGLYTGEMFSIKTPPWEFWETMSEAHEAKKLITDQNNQPKYTEEELKEEAKIIAFFGSKPWIIGHAIAFVLLTLLINAFFDVTSLSLTRLMLREALSSSSTLLVFCIFFTNFIIACLLSTLSIVLVMFCFSPFLVLFAKIAATTIVSHTSLTIIGIFAGIVALWNLGGVWLKIIGITTVLPILILCFSLLLFMIIYPFRNKLHLAVKHFLFKTVSHEKGIFVFLVITFFSLGSIIGILSQILK